LHSNPFRDFDLHPIDQVQVERLKASIDADGFWASVVARKAADGYQIAFGHHRIEAARALGLESVPIEVRDLSDWQMVRMLASENATQRGSTAAACLDAVAAIAQVLAYNLLRWDEAGFCRIPQKSPIDYARCRGRLEAGGGLGRDCIQVFAPDGAFSNTEIEIALGVLKDGGRMASIIAAASARAEAELQAEQEAAEQAWAAAREREAQAASEAERKASAKATKAAAREAGKRQKSIEGARKAASSATRRPIIFDPRCARLFKRGSHLETFRQTVTDETFSSYRPPDQQYEFAKSILAAIRKNNPNKKEITAADIRTECWNRFENDEQRDKSELRTAPERRYQQEMIDGLNFTRHGFIDCRHGAALLARAIHKGETLTAKQHQQLDEYIHGLEAALAICKEIHTGQAAVPATLSLASDETVPGDPSSDAAGLVLPQ
jgi:ParB-like chromosome segregation protein Spo0J